jgi:hypothetical protein
MKWKCPICEQIYTDEQICMKETCNHGILEGIKDESSSVHES